MKETWEAWVDNPKSNLAVTGPTAAAALVAAQKIQDSGYAYFTRIASTQKEAPAIAIGESQKIADERALLIAAAPELKTVADNFQINGPDDDGLIWLVLHGNGTTGKAMFNLGRAEGIAGQVALCLEEDRCAAIAKATGGAPCDPEHSSEAI